MQNMKNGKHSEMSGAGDVGNGVQESSSGIKQNFENRGLPQITPPSGAKPNILRNTTYPK